MVVGRISSGQLNLPPNWINRVQTERSTLVNSNEIKKVLGEPIPRAVDPQKLPPHIVEMFEPNGVLEKIRAKLARIRKDRNKRKKGGAFIPCEGTIASVDEDGNVYVGVSFLEQFGHDEDLLAGILAHEWGHMMSDIPFNVDWNKLTWDELHAMRRDEEGDADGFAGRALFLMGYSPDSMIDFLHLLEKKRKDKNLQTHKYHNNATRIEIVKQSFNAAKRSMADAKQIFGDKVKLGKVLGDG